MSSPSSRRRVVVLVSGGMDSVSLLHHLAREADVVAGLTFEYGAKHNAREIPFAVAQCRALGVRHEIASLDFMDRLFRSDLLRSGGAIPDGHYTAANMKQTVVPFRNGILLSIAAGLAESLDAQAVAIAAHSGDHVIYPDCREAFMHAMGEAIRQGTDAGIELWRPFIGLDKGGIARRGHALGVDFRETWSCYKGGEQHCGRCGTCVERREAFQSAGLTDPTRYIDTGPLPEAPNHGSR